MVDGLLVENMRILAEDGGLPLQLRRRAALRPASDAGTVNAPLVSAIPHRDFARFELFDALQ